MINSDRPSHRDHVNVTLGSFDPARNPFAGKKFPCGVCGNALDIRISRKQKPYCVCQECGIQIFFRGKVGIARLQRIIDSELLSPAGNTSHSNLAILLFNRIQHLKKQRRELEEKQGLIFRDEDLQNTIRVVDNEIERVQGELEKISRENSGRAKL